MVVRIDSIISTIRQTFQVLGKDAAIQHCSCPLSQHGELRQKTIHPVSMGFEQAEQTGSFGQFEKILDEHITL